MCLWTDPPAALVVHRQADEVYPDEINEVLLRLVARLEELEDECG